MSHHRTAARMAAAATATTEVRSPRSAASTAPAPAGPAAAAKLDAAVSAAASILPSSPTAHIHSGVASPTMSRALSEAGSGSSGTQRSSALSSVSRSNRQSDWSSSGFDLTALSELPAASASASAASAGPSSGVATATASSATSPATGSITLDRERDRDRERERSRHHSGGITPGSPPSGPCSPQLSGMGTEVARLRRKLTRSRASLEDYAARNLALESENALLKLQLADALRLARGSMAGGGAWDPDASAPHDPPLHSAPSLSQPSYPQSPSQQQTPTVMGALTFDLDKVALLGLSAEAQMSMHGHPDVVVAAGAAASARHSATSPVAVDTASATVSPVSSTSSRLRSPSEAMHSPTHGSHPPPPPQRHFSMPHTAAQQHHQQHHHSSHAQGSAHHGHSSRASYPSALQGSSHLLHAQSPQLPLHHPAHPGHHHVHAHHPGHAGHPFSLANHTQSSYSTSSASSNTGSIGSGAGFLLAPISGLSGANSSASSGLASPAGSPLGGPSGGGPHAFPTHYPSASPPLQPFQPASPGLGSLSRAREAGLSSNTQSPRASIHRHALLSIDTEAHRRASQVSSLSSAGSGSAATASSSHVSATPTSARTTATVTTAADQPLSPFVLSPSSASSAASPAGAGGLTHPLRPGGRSAMAVQGSPLSAPYVEPYTPCSPPSFAPPSAVVAAAQAFASSPTLQHNFPYPGLELSARSQMADMQERADRERDRAAHLSPLRQMHTQHYSHQLHHLQLGPAAHFSNVSSTAAVPFSMTAYLSAHAGAIHASEGADALANVTALHSASTAASPAFNRQQQLARSPPLSGLGDAATMQPMPPMSPSFEASSPIGSPGGRSARLSRANHAATLSVSQGAGVNESNAGRRLTTMQDMQSAMPPLLLSLAGGRAVSNTCVADGDDLPSSPPTLPPTPSTSVSSSSHSRDSDRESSSNSNSSLSASAVSLRSAGAGAGEQHSAGGSVHSPSAPITSPPVGPVGRSRANSRGGNGLRFGQEEVYDSPAPTLPITMSMHGHSASMGVSLSHAPHVAAASPMLRALSMGSTPGSSFNPASPLLSPSHPQHGAMRGSQPEIFASAAVAEQLMLGKHSKRLSDGSAAAAGAADTPTAQLVATSAHTPSASTSPSSGRSLSHTPAAQLSSAGPSPSLPEENDASEDAVTLVSPRTILATASAASATAAASAASASSSSSPIASSASVVPVIASPVISSPRLLARKTSTQSARLAGSRKRSGSNATAHADPLSPSSSSAAVDPGIALQALQIDGLEDHRVAPKIPSISQGNIVSGTTR